MIEVDGRYGEGGGQILRSSLALSVITGEKIRIRGIRAKRPKPGLKPQHLEAVKAVSKIASGKLEGARIGSTELIFEPGYVRGGRYKFDIGTAGSVTLLLQTVIPLLIFSNEKSILEVRGGTDVRWSPSADYFGHVFLALLEKGNIGINFDMVRRGYYPKGCGLVRVEIEPSRARSMNFMGRGPMKKVWGIVHSNLREEITHRLAESIEARAKIEEERSNAISQGIGITLMAEYEETVLGSCLLGERGIRAEDVGRKCSSELEKEMRSGATLDLHALDQLIPYIALFGGAARARKLSGHASTNLYVSEIFLGDIFDIEENLGWISVSSRGSRGI